MRHALQRASPVFATLFPYIPVYIVTYDVTIFWSVNSRNIIADKANVGIFSVFSIVKYVSPGGFFGIQILPNSITVGELTTLPQTP